MKLKTKKRIGIKRNKIKNKKSNEFETKDMGRIAMGMIRKTSDIYI